MSASEPPAGDRTAPSDPTGRIPVSPPSTAADRTIQQSAGEPPHSTLPHLWGEGREGGPPGSVDDDRTLRQELPSSFVPWPGDSSAAPSAGSRYRVLQLHARGGLGIVYLAEDVELHRRVALKEIQLQHAHDARSRQRFLLEAEITGRLAHPGVVPVHGLGQHADGRPFYVMRFVEGETLLDAIDRFHKTEPGDPGQRRLGLRQLLKHFVDVCNAVAYAHSQGVIHRDLKPSNILLGKYGETLLVDWGLAKYLGVCQADMPALAAQIAAAPVRPSDELTLPLDAATVIGAAIGTPAYMSPEQAAGLWDSVGVASDVYSLGATLYTLLTGASPLPKPDHPGDWLHVPLGGIAPPTELAPSTPKALEAICRKAMQLQAQDRYPGALALAADVEHWLGDEPVSALPEGLLARAGRWARLHSQLVTGVSAAVLVAGLSLAVGVALLAQHNREISHANLLITDVNQQLRDSNRQLADANAEILAANRLTLKAVDDFFTDVSENPRLLRKEPGTQALRRALLERARAYYEGFLRERASDAALQAETASAYFRLAAILEQLNPGPQALDLYRKAEEMRAARVAATSPDAAAEFDLAVTRNHIGKMLHDMGRSPEALAAFETARDALARLSADHPDRPDYAKEFARVLDNIGVTLHTLGRGREALAVCDQARSILQRLFADHPNHADIGQEYATALGILGALQRIGGQPADAVQTLTNAQELLERLAHENPDRAEFVQESGRTSNALAIALTQVNRTVDALAAYEKSRATREKLARENPGVAEYAQELALTYNNMATLLRTLGRPDDAVASCKKAKEVQEKLATEHPDIFDYQQDLARTCNNLGILYADQFKRTDAIAESRRAVAIQEKLAETQPRNVQLLHELAKSSHNLGRFLAALGRFDEAIPAFARAKELRQRFAGDSAAQPAHFTELAESHLALCRAHRDRRQFDESLTEVTRVLALCEKVPESQATILCRTALAEQAMSLSLAGRHAEALADWDRALKLADAASLPLLQLRRATAQVRGGDSTGLEIAKTAAANPNADAAILLEAARSFALSADPAHRANSFELLKRALDAGAFRDPAQILALKTDPDFAVLQNLPDFAAWLEKLEATER